MDKNALMLKLADILQVSPAEMDESFALNADNWDSVAHLGAIAVIDEVCNVTVPAKELMNCQTVGAVLILVERSLASA
jgi:acyl carrier protein